MRISARLFLAFILVILPMIAFGVILIFSVTELKSYIYRLNELGQHQALAGNLRFNVAWLAMPANDYIITAKREEYLKEFQKQSAIVEENLRKIESAELTAEDKGIIKEIRADYEQIKKLTHEIFSISSPIGKPQAMKLMEEMDYKYAHPASVKTTRLFDALNKKREAVSIAARKAEKKVIIVIGAGIFVSVVMSSVIAFFIGHSISRPIEEMASLSQRVSSGDMNVAIDIKRADEIGVLAASFNSMAINLKNSLEKQKELHNKLSRKVQQMAILHEAITDIASDIEIGPLLERLAFYTAHIAKAELSAILVLHPETGEMQHFKTNVSPDEFPVKRFPEGKGLLGVVVRDGVPLYLNNASADPRSAGLPYGHPPISALIGIPLLSKSGVIGGVFVANKQNGGSFTEEDNDSLMMLALQAVTAIENARLYNKTMEIATKDTLTGIANRRVFREELDKEILRANRYNLALSLLMIDIDHFKQINDTYGHPAGDAVLKTLASMLKNKIRQIDLSARYGGEEFAILLPQTSIEGAMVVGERIRKTVSGHSFIINEEKRINVTVTVSIGVTAISWNVRTAEGLIEIADKALYSAKKAGRNRVIPG